jgi:hypothetical protein
MIGLGMDDGAGLAGESLCHAAKVTNGSHRCRLHCQILPFAPRHIFRSVAMVSQHLLRIQLRIHSLFPPISVVNLKLIAVLTLILASSAIDRIQPTDTFGVETCLVSINDSFVA